MNCEYCGCDGPDLTRDRWGKTACIEVSACENAIRKLRHAVAAKQQEPQVGFWSKLFNSLFVEVDETPESMPQVLYAKGSGSGVGVRGVGGSSGETRIIGRYSPSDLKD